MKALTAIPVQRGKPQQNAYTERYNRSICGEWLIKASLKP
jgi:hypothetical protein